MTAPITPSPLLLAEGLSREFLLHHRFCPQRRRDDGVIMVAVAPDALLGGLEDLAYVAPRSLRSESSIQDNVVQYKGAGIKLSVTPTISIDGSVQLDVSQEVSNATTETAFNAPVIATRSVKTQLIVRDNQSLALGRLRDQGAM